MRQMPLWIVPWICLVGAVSAQSPATRPSGELAEITPTGLDAFLARLCDREPDAAKRLAAIAAATTGQRYAESPLGEATYDAHDPKPLYALDRSDSRSFVEQAVAMAVSGDFQSFFLTLQRLRYHGGQVSTAGRTHNLLADWVPNAWLLEDVTTQCWGGMAWVPAHQVVRRAAFLQERYRIAADLPDEKFIGGFIPRCFMVRSLDDLRDGDIVLLITGDDRQQFCTQMGILLKDPGDAAEPFRIIHAQPPAVVREPFREMLRRRTDILGFQALRLRPDAVDLARIEAARLAGSIAVPAD